MKPRRTPMGSTNRANCVDVQSAADEIHTHVAPDYAEQPHGLCLENLPPAEAMRHNPRYGIMTFMPISA